MRVFGLRSRRSLVRLQYCAPNKADGCAAFGGGVPERKSGVVSGRRPGGCCGAGVLAEGSGMRAAIRRCIGMNARDIGATLAMIGSSRGCGDDGV